MGEIIYVCNSINNKNVREGELKILRKSNYDKLCFEFGESEMNLKKRFYNNQADFEKDFNALLKLKEKQNKVKETEIKDEDSAEENQSEEKPRRKNLYI